MPIVQTAALLWLSFWLGWANKCATDYFASGVRGGESVFDIIIRRGTLQKFALQSRQLL